MSYQPHPRPRPRRQYEDIGGRALTTLALISLIAWEAAGFIRWLDTYGLPTAILATFTLVGNLLLPFLTGAWGYLWWGVTSFAAMVIGASLTADPREDTR